MNRRLTIPAAGLLAALAVGCGGSPAGPAPGDPEIGAKQAEARAANYSKNGVKYRSPNPGNGQPGTSPAGKH